MARSKVQRKLIENRSLRNSTYRRRIQGLKKKTYELATLCDVPAFLISFRPDGRVETWPESSEQIKDVFRRYNSVSGSKVSNRNKLDTEGFLELEIEKKRKELNRIAMDSAGKLQELIKSLDSKLGDVNERMRLLSNQRFTEMLEEQKPTLLDSFKVNDMENCNQNIGFGSTTFETLPALENDNDDPDIGFWEQMAHSTSLYDIFKTDGKVFEEENNADFIGLKDCSDDNQNGVGFDSVFPRTETMGSSSTFPLTGQANALNQNDGFDSLYEHMDFSASLTASPFGASFGSVDAQIAMNNCVQSPYEASTCYEQASISDELLLADGIFDDCQFVGYEDAQPLWSGIELGLGNTLPVW